MFEELENRRRRLDAFRPFDAEALRRLDRVFQPWFIYSSNAIEGNTLSLADTIGVILEQKLPAGKTEIEYLEVKGQQDAWAYLHQAVANGYPVNEKLIREFHQLLTDRLDHEKYGPGRYKTRDNQVLLPDGSTFPYVPHHGVPQAIAELVRWLDSEARALHPVERAAQFHYRFILIHPFLDGNGRTARTLTNLLLLRDGYVTAVFRGPRRAQYLGALRGVDTSVSSQELSPTHPGLNYYPLTAFLEEELLWSFDEALKELELRPSVEPEDLVRRFASLEQRALEGGGVAVDEQARLEELARTTRSLIDAAYATVQAVTGRLASAWKTLAINASKTIEPAHERLGHEAQSDRLRRTALALDATSEVRGAVGLVQLQVQLRPQSLIPVRVPHNSFELVAYAEPHRILLGSVISCIVDGSVTWDGTPPDRWSARLELPTDKQLWLSSQIEAFVVRELERYFATVEREIARLNAAPTA